MKLGGHRNSETEQFGTDPVAFMSRNVVTPQFLDPISPVYAGPPTDSAEIQITLKPWGQKRSSKKGGKCYYFSRDIASARANEIFTIYWLAYKQNNKKTGQLTSANRLMFTALMNGCTLGIGSQAGDGACLVAHANKSSAGSSGRDGQRAAQHGQLGEAFGAAAFSSILPDSYQATSNGSFSFQATNFGVNVGNTWEFYTHRWLPSGGTGGVVLHDGVRRAAPVPTPA